jgi:hypothetical protein
MYITSKDISRTASILNFEEAHLKILKLQLSQNFLCHSFLIITENTKIFLEVEREREAKKKYIYIYTHTHTYIYGGFYQNDNTK